LVERLDEGLHHSAHARRHAARQHAKRELSTIDGRLTELRKASGFGRAGVGQREQVVRLRGQHLPDELVLGEKSGLVRERLRESHETVVAEPGSVETGAELRVEGGELLLDAFFLRHAASVAAFCRGWEKRRKERHVQRGEGRCGGYEKGGQMRAPTKSRLAGATLRVDLDEGQRSFCEGRERGLLGVRRAGTSANDACRSGTMQTKTRSSLREPRSRSPLARAAYFVIASLSTVATVALVSPMVGCVATAESMPTRGVVVSGPPPAPLNEPRPEPPQPRAAWVAGYWHWTGMQYAWIPGHWDRGAQGQWVGPRYFQQGGQYRYEAGQWARGNAIR
jgi:hypothetical protein